MSRFLVLYRATSTVAEQMTMGTREQVQSGMEACMARAQGAGDAVVDLGAHPHSAMGGTVEILEFLSMAGV
jgi:hypothetical protein